MPDKNKIAKIRAWEPGDGIYCTRSKQAPTGHPCGPPVVVYTTAPVPDRYGFGRGIPARTSVVCRNHIPASITAGEATAKAKKAAQEAVIVAHWEEYQETLAVYERAALDERLADLPAELREQIKGGSRNA